MSCYLLNLACEGKVGHLAVALSIDIGAKFFSHTENRTLDLSNKCAILA